MFVAHLLAFICLSTNSHRRALIMQVWLQKIVGIIMFPQDCLGFPGKAYNSPISFLLHSPKHPVRGANSRFPRVSLISCLSQRSSSCPNRDNSQPSWRKQFSYSSSEALIWNWIYAVLSTNSGSGSGFVWFSLPPK